MVMNQTLVNKRSPVIKQKHGTIPLSVYSNNKKTNRKSFAEIINTNFKITRK